MLGWHSCQICFPLEIKLLLLLLLLVVNGLRGIVNFIASRELTNQKISLICKF